MDRRSPALADYVPRTSWVVMPSAYDEEEAEARSARLAAAEVRVSQVATGGGGTAAQEPATPRSQLLRMTSEEALVIGESTVNVMMWLLPATRGKPHACIFTVSNLVVLLLLFFWMLDTYAPLSQDVSALTLFVWGGRSDGRIAATAEIWRYITSMMLHTSITHLASNLLTFLFASASLERRYGWWLVAPLYIMAGVGANLFSATWEGCDIVVGASGAVLGLCSALLVDVLFAYKSMRLVGTRLGFLLVVLCNLVVQATKEARHGGSKASGSQRSATSNWSHIGGAATGLACAGMLLPLLTAASSEAPRQSPRDSRAAMLRRSAAITLWALCACVLVFTFCVLPLNMAGFLGSRNSFGSQPKHCACDGWCRCDFGSEGAAAAGTPCSMAQVVFRGDASMHAIKG